MSVTLQTKRLELVPSSTLHAGSLFPLMSDERLTRFLTWAPHRDPNETERVLASLMTSLERGDAYHWTIFEERSARGIISLIDVRRRHRLWTLDRAEIAYWVGVDNHGRGIASEATAAVIEHAFAQLALHRLVISHTSDNPASGSIPIKLGFRLIGTEREFFKKNDVWHDMNHYELLVEDWIAISMRNSDERIGR